MPISSKVRPWLLGAMAMVLLSCLVPGRCPSPAQSSPPTITQVQQDAELPGTLALPSPDEVIVAFRPGVDEAQAQDAVSALHLTLTRNSPFAEDYWVARTEPGQAAQVAERLSRDSRVEYAEPNFHMAGAWNRHEQFPLDLLRQRSPAETRITPNDPLYKYQWHMHKIDVGKAWVATMGAGAVVAVIDTGVAYEDHADGSFRQVEDLKGTRFVKGYNFVSGNEHANDDHGHGTHVAGTVAQATNNATGVAGVASKAAIMPLKVLSASGTGRVSDIADAIRFAANHGANVINMSLGGPVHSRALENAIKHADKKGVTIVCAAGNSNSENVSYPARYPECIAVSATRFDDQLTFYTNRGKRIDIAAPGGDMTVDQNGDGYMDGVLQNTIVIRDPTQQTYALFQGTSMAAPHVAGAAALLVSLGITNPKSVRQRLVSTARKEGLGDLDRGYGGGVLDVGKAAYKTALEDPLSRLLLASVLLLTLGILSPVRPRLSLPLVGMLVLGSSGLFFLPYLGLRVPLLAVFQGPIPEWDLLLAGAGSHASAIFWSALLPWTCALLTFGQRRLQSACLGLAVGVAAFLLHETFFTTALIEAVPGWFLTKTWLLANAAACMFLAYVLVLAGARQRADLEVEPPSAP